MVDEVTSAVAVDTGDGPHSRPNDTVRLLRLDLSCVRLLLVGAEPISPRVWREFTARAAPAGLDARAPLPVNGLAEATLAVTVPPLGETASPLVLDRAALSRGRAVETDPGPHAVELTDLGRRVQGCEVRITGESRDPVGELRVGHVQVRGPQLGRGHRRAPEASASAFGDDGWLPTRSRLPAGRTAVRHRAPQGRGVRQRPYVPCVGPGVGGRGDAGAAVRGRGGRGVHGSGRRGRTGRRVRATGTPRALRRRTDAARGSRPAAGEPRPRRRTRTAVAAGGVPVYHQREDAPRGAADALRERAVRPGRGPLGRRDGHDRGRADRRSADGPPSGSMGGLVDLPRALAHWAPPKPPGSGRPVSTSSTTPSHRRL